VKFLTPTQPRLQMHGANNSPQKQRGVVLIVALLVLVALTIASLGLLRSVDTTTAATGNLGFKKDIYRQSNRGVQNALDRLASIRNGLELPFADNKPPGGAGYYATATLPVDPRGIPVILVNAAVPTTPGVAPTTGDGIGQFAVPIGDPSGGGYLFRYTAERLCPLAGAPVPSTNDCRQAAGAGQGSTYNSGPKIQPAGSVYVRLTLRVDGPKNSVSYFQMMVL
jgi:type IV pilus assembly protein PilX